jgi:SAM-dependent methyltransferase
MGSRHSRGCRGSRLHDEALRGRKASKVLAILATALGTDLSGYTCLDVGCSSGLLTMGLAPSFRFTVGVEPDGQAIQRAANHVTRRLVVVQGDGQSLPVLDASVDVVVCAQVYEHVPDAELLFSEIWRVLPPGGACFFSGPNRLYPVELHAGLPFVHWLPQSWARACLRTIGRGGEDEVRPLTLWALRKRLARFEIEDYTVTMMRDPQGFSCEEEMGRWHWIGRLPGWLLRAVSPMSPNFNWVLRKPND